MNTTRNLQLNRANRNLQICDADGTLYYGGDQAWYASNTWAMAGCGSVAGANSLRLLAMKDPELYSEIRTSKYIPTELKRALLFKRPKKDDYLMLMTGMYRSVWTWEYYPLNRIYDRHERNQKLFTKYLRPNGGASSSAFIRGVLQFSRKHRLHLNAHYLPTAFCSKEQALEFIRAGLNESGCVTLLNSYNKCPMTTYNAQTVIARSANLRTQNATMKNHFACITGITEGDDPRLILSTWGQLATINVSELVESWHSIKAYESTLFYFTTGTPAQTMHDLWTSPLCILKGVWQAILRIPPSQ